MAGLLPAALGLGAGRHVFQDFAITVIGGLAAGTAATLLVLPAATFGWASSAPRWRNRLP